MIQQGVRWVWNALGQAAAMPSVILSKETITTGYIIFQGTQATGSYELAEPNIQVGQTPRPTAGGIAEARAAPGRCGTWRVKVSLASWHALCGVRLVARGVGFQWKIYIFFDTLLTSVWGGNDPEPSIGNPLTGVWGCHDPEPSIAGRP